MLVVFRVDASLQIGSGHLMRCLTLASRLQADARATAQPLAIYFACRAHPGHLLNFIQQQGFGTLPLPAVPSAVVSAKSPEPHTEMRQQYRQWLGASEQADATTLINALNEAALATIDWLVVDHYALGADFCQNMRDRCRLILQIDDLADRRYDCDLLLDQNYLPNFSTRYQGLIPPHCHTLLGPKYALLKPEFAKLHREPRPRLQQFLVFFGGSDLPNLTKIAIDALQQLQFSDWHADIVIGQANPHQELLQHLLSKDRRLTLHVQTPRMAELMVAADLMLGAGGATHWERACLGLPAIVVALADNQLATTELLVDAGVCLDGGAYQQLTAKRLVSLIGELKQDPALLLRMSAAGQQLVPADGGASVLSQWMFKQSVCTDAAGWSQ